jgi:predicted PurR-regulated permease PerM
LSGAKDGPRRIFLAVSAVAVVGIILAARQVLLPFILALVVAYVLLPAVVRVERLRVPRWGAILVVYAITLGAMGGFVWVFVPRLVAEGRALGAEWPHFTATARAEWLPAVDRKIAAWSGGSGDALPPPPGPRRTPPRPRPKRSRRPSGSRRSRTAPTTCASPTA